MTLARQHSDWQIVAADFDDDMLDRGRHRRENEGLRNIEFVRADVTDDLGSEEFDVVLAVECLSEIPDDDAALRAMARALRPGGRFFAHVPHRDWLPVLPGSPRTWRLEVRHGYGVEELDREAEAGGAHGGFNPTDGSQRGLPRPGDRSTHQGLFAPRARCRAAPDGGSCPPRAVGPDLGT